MIRLEEGLCIIIGACILAVFVFCVLHLEAMR